MSIIVMTFSKKWIIFLLILLFVSIGGIIFIWKNIIFSPVQLQDFRWLLQEKIPESDIIKKQINLHKRTHTNQEATIQGNFQIDSALLEKEYTPWENILSGNFLLQTWWQTSKEISTLDMQLSGTMIGLKLWEETIMLNLSTNIEAVIQGKDIYFQIKNVDFTQTPQKSDQLTLRYLLLKQYEKTYIHANTDTFPFIFLFSPEISTKTVLENNKKIRIIPWASWWWIWNFEGDHVQWSWFYLDALHHSFTISLPQWKLLLKKESTNIPHINNIDIRQQNLYSGVFQWVQESNIWWNTNKEEIKGEARWPKWINIDGSIQIIQKEGSWKHTTLPPQYLERNTIIEGWKKSMKNLQKH